jgi:hypothetical protein
MKVNQYFFFFNLVHSNPGKGREGSKLQHPPLRSIFKPPHFKRMPTKYIVIRAAAVA